MAGSRMIELAEQLSKRARDGKVTFEKAPGEDSYRVRFPDMAVVIARLSWLPAPPPPPPGFPPLPDLRRVSTYGFRLELFDDESGAMIGSLAATTGDPEHKVLRDIYQIAEGAESDVEAKIDKALKYLSAEEAESDIMAMMVKALEVLSADEAESEIEQFIAEPEELQSQPDNPKQ